MVGEKVFSWIFDTWRYIVGGGWIAGKLGLTPTKERTEAEYNALPEWAKNNDIIQWAYDAQLAQKRYEEEGLQAPLLDIVKQYQKTVQEVGKKYNLEDITKVEENSAKMSADLVSLALGTAALEFGLSHLPNTSGTVASTKVHTMMGWLGVGAVITAIAHDPFKISFLRPWQDTLEAKYRNRRPGDIALFQAYRTRELSPVKVDDLAKLDDEQMNRIEADNEAVYFREIAKWGYSEWFANALARSATYTLSFSQLVTLARAGIYDKGLTIYSLWGAGIDRVMMPQAIQAIETLRDREMYSGFRSMIEPSYVEGDIEEADLLDYWKLAGVPDKVRDWVLPRLRKRREKAIAKLSGSPTAKERDLTVSQLTTAYVDGMVTREKAKDDIIRLGYDATETEILLKIADTRKKTPSAAKLKRLPLGDYEKAFKAGMISFDAVLLRMQGEYDSKDIELERKLLQGGKA